MSTSSECREKIRSFPICLGRICNSNTSKTQHCSLGVSIRICIKILQFRSESIAVMRASSLPARIISSVEYIFSVFSRRTRMHLMETSGMQNRILTSRTIFFELIVLYGFSCDLSSNRHVY